MDAHRMMMKRLAVVFGLACGITFSLGSRAQQADGPRYMNGTSFIQTGRWPDGTVFILEIRKSNSEASINKAGRFQTDLVSIEAEVKDSRFPDGWAFFLFGAAPSMRSAAEPLSGDRVTSCVECHTNNA